jgi:8-oxo-dGTP pyrophosphatase MutT (NUDIX family)
VRAGVLVPLVPGPNGVEILLTRRTDTVLTHKGQISFPGGQQEKGDADIVETALREAYEEVGLEPSRVEVLGELDDVFTAVSGFVVTPVVGVMDGGLDDLRPAPMEVKSLLVVPISRLLEPAVHTTQTRSANGQRFTIDYYTVGEDVIWGATGRMLNQFLRAWEATS